MAEKKTNNSSSSRPIQTFRTVQNGYERAKVDAALKELNEENAYLQQRNAKLKKDATAFAKRLKKLQGVDIDALRNDNQNYKDEIAKLREQIQELREQNQELQSALEYDDADEDEYLSDDDEPDFQTELDYDDAIEVALGAQSDLDDLDADLDALEDELDESVEEPADAVAAFQESFDAEPEDEEENEFSLPLGKVAAAGAAAAGAAGAAAVLGKDDASDEMEDVWSSSGEESPEDDEDDAVAVFGTETVRTDSAEKSFPKSMEYEDISSSSKPKKHHTSSHSHSAGKSSGSSKVNANLIRTIIYALLGLICATMLIGAISGWYAKHTDATFFGIRCYIVSDNRVESIPAKNIAVAKKVDMEKLSLNDIIISTERNRSLAYVQSINSGAEEASLTVADNTGDQYEVTADTYLGKVTHYISGIGGIAAYAAQHTYNFFAILVAIALLLIAILLFLPAKKSRKKKYGRDFTEADFTI